MNFKSLADKREKFSIRKYKSIGVASAVVGILFLASGRVQAAETTLTDTNTQPKDETVNDKIETTKPLNVELQPKVSEIAVTETAAKPAETTSTANVADKDQPSDKFKMTFRRASDLTLTDTESVESKPVESEHKNDEISSNSSTQPTRSRRGKRSLNEESIVAINRVNNYNPKWDEINSDGEIVRDLNKYSDKEFNKRYLHDEKDTDHSDSEVVESSKPVNEHELNFKTAWDDDTSDDKSGTENTHASSLIGTYSGTEVASNLYVSIKTPKGYYINPSSISEKVGDLDGGTDVYKLNNLNGGSQIEFKVMPSSSRNDIENKYNGGEEKIEYKVYQSKIALKSENLSAGLADAKLLYSKEMKYTYSNLRQAGYELTDKYETVVKNNVSADDQYRNVNLGVYNANNNQPIERFDYVNIKTGLNNGAYSTDYKFGSSVYSEDADFERVNHDDETITVSGLTEGVTPLAPHVDLGAGSYKIKMSDFMKQDHGSTVLALKYTDEFFKSTFGQDVKIRPEYKIERVNKDGRVFVQIVKDSYDFTLSSEKSKQDENAEFTHNQLNPTNDFFQPLRSKYRPGEYVTLVRDNDDNHIKMMSNFEYSGKDSVSKTLVYSLDGADAHFDMISNVDADVYSYNGSNWSYAGAGSANGSVSLPKNTKKVALSYKSLNNGLKEPIFDTSLDDVKTFNSDQSSSSGAILNMFVQKFDEPDAITYLPNNEVESAEKTMVDRTLILKKETWTYHFDSPSSSYRLSDGDNNIHSNLRWETNGPSSTLDHPSYDDIYYFARVDKSLMKFNPVFADVELVSRKTLPDGDEFYLFKKSKDSAVSGYGDPSTSLSVNLTFDGASAVDKSIVFGKIDKYSNGSESDNMRLESNKLVLGSDEIDLSGNLTDYKIETSVVNVKFESLRESFSKLSLFKETPHVDNASGKTINPYSMVGTINNASTEDRILKNAIMSIPKAKDGTILNLSKHLSSNDKTKYYYEINGSGSFVEASDDVDLKTITKVKIEYTEPIRVTPEDPWVWNLPLTLDERSTSDKKAVGYLELENGYGSKQITNSVDLSEDYHNLLKNDGSLNIDYYVIGYAVDERLHDNPLAKFEMDKSFDFSNTKLIQESQDIKAGAYHYVMLLTTGRVLPPSMSIQHLMTGTDGLVKFNPDESFENAVTAVGRPGYQRIKLVKTASDEFNHTNYILKYVLKRDKDGHLSKLSKDDVFRISDDWTIVPVYEIVSKPEFRGFIYKEGVDSSDDEVRRRTLFDLAVYHSYGRIKHLYADKVGDLDFGKSVVRSYREIQPRVEIDENERFRRVRTYTYTYHKLNDIDGFKDDGTRTVTNAAFDSENYYLNNGLFFYDEHIDEKIEWKTKSLTVNYVDADTNKILNTYTVQRLKDEKLGEFDKSYTDYSYVRSDFTESDLMGDADRTINMYFSRNKAILRTETYVDDVLVNTVDKTVDTFSPIPNDKPVNAIEYNGKLASYDSTEVENDSKLVGDKDSVTTIKHHYHTASTLTSPTVNMIFKDGDTVLGSAIIKSNKSGNELMWELVDSNSSDSFIDEILNRSIYKPADGQDWKPNGRFRTGEVATVSDKLLYNVEFSVVKKEGRLTISYVDSKTGEKIISDEVYNPVVIGTEYNDIKPGLKLPSKEEHVHQNGKLMKRLEFYVKSKDNKIDPVTIKEGDNNAVFKYDKIVKFVDVNVEHNTNVGDVPVNEIPEYTDPIGSNDSDGEGNTINPPAVEIPEYTDPIGSNDSDDEGNAIPAPIVEIPEYSGGANPNDAPVVEVREFNGGVNPNDAPTVEIPEYSGGVNPNEAPVYDKPDFNGGVTPNDAPINEIQEYTDPIGGNGLDGEGNTIAPPTVEIPEYTDPIGMNPDDAPIHEVPEFEGGVNPDDAPIHEIPEFNGGVNPNDAPIHEAPEFNDSVTPNDAPIHELPEFEGGVNPDDAPVHELPELEIPDVPASPIDQIDPVAPILPHVTDHRRTNEVPSTTHRNDAPSIETPMYEQNTGSDDQTYVDKSTTSQLPNTGTVNSSSMLAAGLASAISAVGLMLAGFKRKKDN